MNNHQKYGPFFLIIMALAILSACDNGDIVFTRDSSENAELFTMSADGSDINQLTDNKTRDAEPVWGPFGDIIVFESRRETGRSYGIYKLTMGKNPVVTKVIDTPLRDSYPDVSPNGNKVVFASDVTPGFDRTGPAMEIFIVNMDGTNLTRLTYANGVDRNPHWSPDGSKIVFVSERDSVDEVNPNQEIYVMNADGSNQTRLTFAPDQDIDPHWSPDGSKIAFSSNRDRNPEIYIMNANGSGVVQVTFTVSDTLNVGPTWSPDGTQIIFSREYLSTHDDDLYRINTDGTGLTQLTSDSTLSDNHPDWKHPPPDSTK